MNKKNLATGLVAAFFAIMVAVSCGKPSSDSNATGTGDTVPPPSGEQEYQADQTAPQPDTVKDTTNRKP